MAWQYKVQDHDEKPEPASTEQILDALGREGWELVQAITIPGLMGGFRWRYILKRLVVASQEEKPLLGREISPEETRATVGLKGRLDIS
jgi:hypothetical protein